METGGSAASVSAAISGEVRGQVAVGNNIVQYNVDHGGVVWAADPAGLPRPRLREHVKVRGRPPRLVGREAELRTVTETLTPATPVELAGPAGIGKTSLLKHLAHHLPVTGVGVVYHDARGEPAEDILQFLYDSFYDAGIPFKPTPGQLREALASVVGLVVLDELALDRVDVESVLDAAPEATFVLASEEQQLWGQGRSLSLRGLPTEASVALLERELGRPVVGDERASADEACRALEGSPLRVVQLAALVRGLGEAMTDAAASLAENSAGGRLVSRLRSSLGPEQLRVMAILEAAMGASLSAQHLAELVGVPDIGAAVEPLLQTGLVQAHSPRYSVREPNREQKPRRDGRGPHPVAEYLAALGEADRQPDRLAEEAAAIVATLGQVRQQGDWTTVLRLGRATERALALSRRWGAWDIVLRHQLEAARTLGDRGAEAWALHQLGTRALCLDDPVTARAHLIRALAVRQALGDVGGTAATRHNLEHLDGPPPPPSGRDTPPPPVEPPSAPRSGRRVMAAIAAVAAALLVVGIGIVVLRGGDTSEKTLRIQGIGYSVRIEPADVDFGEAPVGSVSAPRRLTILNAGSSPLRVGPLAGIDAALGFEVVADACTATDLPPGGRCDVEVVFRPTATGSQQANAAVPLPDRTMSVTFTGRGVRPPVVTHQPPPTEALTTLPSIVVPTTRPPVITTTTTTPPTDADLAVRITCPLPNCVVTVTNNGPATATGVRLGVLFGPGSVHHDLSCTVVVCSWPSIASGEVVTTAFNVDFILDAGGGLPLSDISVRGAEPDPRPANNSQPLPPLYAAPP